MDQYRWLAIYCILFDKLILFRGMSREDAQRKFIVETNKLLTKYGWNPPIGWR